jgi:hypothetical protein
MTLQEIKRKIAEDPDFVNIKRFDYSLEKLLERYPDGAPNRVIAHALCIAEDEVEELYRQAVAHLREIMGVSE